MDRFASSPVIASPATASSANAAPPGADPAGALPRAADIARASAARSIRWRPGLPCEGVAHSEIFASGRTAGGAGFALALALDALGAAPPAATREGEDRRAILWVQDRAALRATGRPYRFGLPETWRHRLIHVLAEKPEDALFALEEGVRCRDLACVIGEVAGNPRALDFTASRRLTLAAQRHGVALWLVRIDAARDLSSARMRWDVRAAPSPAPRWDAQAPGPAAWQAELFRARAHAPGAWTLHAQDDRLAVVEPVEGDAPTDRARAEAPE